MSSGDMALALIVLAVLIVGLFAFIQEFPRT